MLDLDGLKQVNDSDGHEAGDRLIRTAAEHIADDIRHSDLAARLAGDEFVVLCPETQRARARAARARSSSTGSSTAASGRASDGPS